MVYEIQIALNFFISFLYNKLPRRRVNLFGEELELALESKLCSHWYPSQPNKGSAFRCLRLGDPLDSVFEIACRQSGVSIIELRDNTPLDLCVWIDPGEVSYRIGEKGQIKLLYSASLSNSATSSLPVGNPKFENQHSVVNLTRIIEPNDCDSEEFMKTHGQQMNKCSTLNTFTPISESSSPISTKLSNSFSQSIKVQKLLDPNAATFLPINNLTSVFEKVSIQDFVKSSEDSLGMDRLDHNQSSVLPLIPSPVSSTLNACITSTSTSLCTPYEHMFSRHRNPQSQLTFTTATFAQTKFGSTKMKSANKRNNRMSPTQFSNYIKQRALMQQQRSFNQIVAHNHHAVHPHNIYDAASQQLRSNKLRDPHFLWSNEANVGQVNRTSNNGDPLWSSGHPAQDSVGHCAPRLSALSSSCLPVTSPAVLPTLVDAAATGIGSSNSNVGKTDHTNMCVAPINDPNICSNSSSQTLAQHMLMAS